MKIVMKHTNISTGGEPKMAPEEPEDDGGVIAALDRERERQQRTGLSSLRMADDEAKAVQKTEHRVTLDSILAKIVHTQYIYPAAIPHMTIAVVILENGFAIVGKSAPADPENFNLETGQKFAREDAIRQVWPLEAYALRERLTKED